MTFHFRLWRDTCAQDLAEYAVAFGIVTVAVIALVATFGGDIVALLQRCGNAIGIL